MNAELPIVFYYTKGDGGAESPDKTEVRRCLICELAKVRNGRSLVFNIDSLYCGGARRYLGFTNKMRPGFEYFLSCGNDQTEPNGTVTPFGSGCGTILTSKAYLKDKKRL